jgi:hypothetical protein
VAGGRDFLKGLLPTWWHAPGGCARAFGPELDRPNIEPIGVESVRRLSAVSLVTSGSTTACWSSLSVLISTNVLVLQSLPSEKQKVAGSTLALASRIHACQRILL